MKDNFETNIKKERAEIMSIKTKQKSLEIDLN